MKYLTVVFAALYGHPDYGMSMHRRTVRIKLTPEQQKALEKKSERECAEICVLDSEECGS